MNEIQNRRLNENSQTPEQAFWEIYAEGLPVRYTDRELREHLRYRLYYRERWERGQRPIIKLDVDIQRRTPPRPHTPLTREPRRLPLNATPHLPHRTLAQTPTPRHPRTRRIHLPLVRRTSNPSRPHPRPRRRRRTIQPQQPRRRLRVMQCQAWQQDTPKPDKNVAF
jgi:hypothetical protein